MSKTGIVSLTNNIKKNTEEAYCRHNIEKLEEIKDLLEETTEVVCGILENEYERETCKDLLIECGVPYDPINDEFYGI